VRAEGWGSADGRAEDEELEVFARQLSGMGTQRVNGSQESPGRC
jgi:hypothetical protein